MSISVPTTQFKKKKRALPLHFLACPSQILPSKGQPLLNFVFHIPSLNTCICVLKRYIACFHLFINWSVESYPMSFSATWVFVCLFVFFFVCLS